MSTRATYEFTRENAPSIFAYIHHDGYPEGAAAYFYHALTDAKRGQGCLATRFLRANPRAELTDSHEVHADTEYRHIVTHENGETILRSHAYQWESETWELEKADEIHRYLNSHLPGPGLRGEDFHPFKIAKINPYCKATWHNAKTAGQILFGKGRVFDTLKTWRDNGNDRGANWNAKVEELNLIIGAFPELMGAAPENRQNPLDA